MSTHEDLSPKTQSALSLKSMLMTATIVIFLILHVAGAVFIHRATAVQPHGISLPAPSGD